MQLEMLRREAERLARRGELLLPTGLGSPVAWVYPYSIGAVAIALALGERIVAVVPDARRGGSVTTVPDVPAGGTPLFAHAWTSYPPIEAIFLFGGAVIQEWLEANGWERTWGYNDNFPDREAVEAYESWWQSTHPFYTSSALAVRGGWHFVWPDDDWYERLNDELLVWTTAGEPWIEVWAESRGLRVLQRYT